MKKTIVQEAVWVVLVFAVTFCGLIIVETISKLYMS